jgi:hypothetical protein
MKKAFLVLNNYGAPRSISYAFGNQQMFSFSQLWQSNAGCWSGEFWCGVYFSREQALGG